MLLKFVINAFRVTNNRHIDKLEEDNTFIIKNYFFNCVFWFWRKKKVPPNGKYSLYINWKLAIVISQNHISTGSNWRAFVMRNVIIYIRGITSRHNRIDTKENTFYFHVFQECTMESVKYSQHKYHLQPKWWIPEYMFLCSRFFWQLWFLVLRDWDFCKLYRAMNIGYIER